MTKILFVCHGNICRSTMAEYVMKYLVRETGLEDAFFIDSAGTSREEIGNGAHYGIVAKLRSVGIPVGNHRARQITQADFENFDYIVAMDRANVRNLQAVALVAYRDKISKLLSYAGIADDIADPWYTGNFDETYEDVMTGCKALLKKIRPF